MEIILNNDNLLDKEVEETKVKVRAIIEHNNKLLVAKYGSALILPGGKQEEKESNEEALLRELKEEIGSNYEISDLEYKFTIKQYQKNYKKRDDRILNRLIITHFYLCEYKEIDSLEQHLSESEKNNNFKLNLLSIKDIKKYIDSSLEESPRDKYFKQELETILNIYSK